MVSLKTLCTGLLIFSCLWGHLAFALTIKPIKNDQTVLLKISAKELSRIFIANDRIQAVRGQNGTYTIKNDPIDGEIFIQPTEEFVNKSFSVFITTEQGRHFTLLFVPINVPAQTIGLKPQSPASFAASAWEQAQSYEKNVLALIKAMQIDKPPVGFVKIADGKTSSWALKKIYVVRLEMFLGAKLRGEILQLSNRTNSTLTFKAQDFYQPSTRAIALQNEKLAPHEKILLWRVLDNGGQK